jgi:isopenicillin N synthase-like dioxygenase
MNILKIDINQSDAGDRLVESFRNSGFAVLTKHDIDYGLIKSVYQSWSYFFSRPEKQLYKFDPSTQIGYFPFKSENAKDSKVSDLKEFYHYYMRRDNSLPSFVSGATEELFQELESLGNKILSKIDESSPKEIFQHLRSGKDEKVVSGLAENSDLSLLRILNYPPLQEGNVDGAVRAAAHGDINLITLLVAATAPGLQVLDAKGNWVTVETDPNNIVVNIGDMLSLASRGYYPSTVHRVVNPEGEEAKKARMSIPFFVHARNDARLSENLTAGEFLDNRLKEIGLKK